MALKRLVCAWYSQNKSVKISKIMRTSLVGGVPLKTQTSFISIKRFYKAGSRLVQPEIKLLIKILELRGNCFGQTKCEPAISMPFLFKDLKI